MRYSRFRLALKYAKRDQMLIASLFLLLIGAMFTPWFVAPLRRDLRLATEGKIVEATVINKRMAGLPGPALAALLAHGGGKRRSRLVEFEFNVGGRAVRRSERVSDAIWNKAIVGQTISVVYLPSDPSICRAGDPLWKTGLMGPFGTGILAGATGIVCLVRAARGIVRNVRLIATGWPALGIIDCVQTRQHKRQTYVERVAYSFLVVSQAGQQLHRAELNSNIPLAPGQLETGDLVLVMYDQFDARQHAIDYFGARDDEKPSLLANARKLRPGQDA